MRTLNRIILHCSASSYKKQDAAWIRKIHIEERKFKDIGYHYFIRFDGKVECGRSLDEVGSHCQGHNKDSIGICLAGGKLEDFTKAQFDSLRLLIKQLRSMFIGLTVHGHCEYNPHKTCPIFDYKQFTK